MYFWFVLALSLQSTVADLQARMSSREFSQWIAFYEHRPFGPHWEDVRSAVGARNVAGSWLGKTTPSIEAYLPLAPQKENGLQRDEQKIARNVEMALGMIRAAQQQAAARMPEQTPENDTRNALFEKMQREAAEKRKAVARG